MQSIKCNVSNSEVGPVFNKKLAQLLNKRVGIGLVGIKRNTRQEILSFLKLEMFYE